MGEGIRKRKWMVNRSSDLVQGLEIRNKKRQRRRRLLKPSVMGGVKNSASCRFIPHRPHILNNSFQVQFGRPKASIWHDHYSESSLSASDFIPMIEDPQADLRLKSKCENVYESCLEQCILGNNNAKVLQCSSMSANVQNEQSLESLLSQDFCSSLVVDEFKKIGNRPNKKLNAPGLSYDPTRNVLDSGNCGQLAIGLDDAFYIYNKDGKISEINEDYCHYNPNGHPITSLKFSNNGIYLAVAWANNRLIVWDTQTGKKVRELRSGDAGTACPPSVVNDISFSGQYIMVACANGQIQLHDTLRKFSLLAELRYHTVAITSTAWSCDQSHFAVVDINGVVTIWDRLLLLNRCKTTDVLDKPKHVFKLSSRCYSLCWNSEKPKYCELFVGCANKLGTLVLLNGIAGKIVKKVSIGNPICSILYCGAAKTLIVGFARREEATAVEPGTASIFRDGGVTLLNYPDLNKVVKLGDSSKQGAPLHICLSPEKKTLIAGCASPVEPSLRFWKCFRGVRQKKTTNFPGKVFRLR